MKKKASFTLGGLVVVLGGLVIGGQAWLKGRFQKDAVVQQLEQQWNCRAELDSSTATFLSSPARVELNGLKLAPPDAESQKPPGQRAPLDPKAVLASIDHTELSVELWDLLHGQVNVKKLRFDGLGLKGEITDDGKSSLQALFSSPDRTPHVVKVGSDKEKAVTVNGDGHAEGVKVVDNSGDKKNAGTGQEATTTSRKLQGRRRKRSRSPSRRATCPCPCRWKKPASTTDASRSPTMRMAPTACWSGCILI